MTFDLTQLANSVGSDEGLELNRRQGKFKDPFELNKVYPVEITEQEVTTSKGGFYQVALKLTTVKGDGSYGASSKRWIMLPVFSSEKASSEDPEKLKMLKGSFGDRLHSLLKALFPDDFVVARMEKIGTIWHFYDKDGNEIDKATKTAREKLIGKAVIGAAAALESGDFPLTGKRMFYVRTQDKTNPEKTYDNFYSVQPDRYEAAEV